MWAAQYVQLLTSWLVQGGMSGQSREAPWGEAWGGVPCLSFPLRQAEQGGPWEQKDGAGQEVAAELP